MVMVLQGPAIYLALPMMIPHVPDTKTSSLKQMVGVFLESGGRLLVCITWIEEREINKNQLNDNAVPTSDTALSEEILRATLT